MTTTACGRRRAQWRRRAAPLGLILVLATSVAGAQGTAVRDAALPGVVLNGPTSPWVTTLLPRLVAEGDARTFQLVQVRRPTAFPLTAPLHYRVESWSLTTVLGPHEGGMAAGDTLHPLLLSVGIPAGARAGGVVTVRVRFESQGSGSTVVADLPIEVRVHRHHELALTATQTLQAARPGQRLTVRYRVLNRGNGVDTAWSTLRVPPGWTVVATTLTPAVLEPGAGSDRAVDVDIPSQATAGPTSVQVAARPTGDSTQELNAAHVTVQVEILDPRLASSSRTLGLRLGVASATSTVHDVLTPAGATPGSAHAPLAYLVAVDGPLTDRFRLSGRWTHTPSGLDPSIANALYHEGYTDMPAFLDLAGAGLNASVGNASVLFPDIAGGPTYAEGASATYRTSSLHWTGIYGTQIRNPSDTTATPAKMGGATVGILSHGWDVAATVVQLHDQASKVRDLTASGAVVRTPAWFGLQMELGGANRSYGSGSGFGSSIEVDRHGAHDDLLIRQTRTPGGSGAFAPALFQTAVIGSRTVGDRLALTGSYWTSLDSTQTYQSLRSVGWSVGPQLRIAPHTDLRLDARQSAYDAAGGIDAFGSTTTSGMATLTSSVGVLYGSLSVGEQADTRHTQLDSVGVTTLSGQRGTWMVRSGVSSTRGQMEVSASGMYAVRGSSTGANPSLLTARLDRVQPLVGHPEWTVHADVQAANWQGEGPLSIRSYAGFSLILPRDVEVALDAEHVPTLGLGSAAGWSLGLRVERTFGLPSFAARGLGVSGVVYDDRNGNGRRDPGEPGVGNVVVRRGTETVITDRLGRYRFATVSNSLPAVDVRSLPVGWLARQTTRRASLAAIGGVGQPGAVPDDGSALLRAGGVVDLAVRRTATVHLHVGLEAGSDSSVANQDLRQVSASLTDSSAQSWSAPLNARGDAAFDGLPAGRYAVDLDVSHLSQPLRIRAAPQYAIVDTGTSTVALMLIPRTAKVFAAAGVGRVVTTLGSLTPLASSSAPMMPPQRVASPPPLRLTRDGRLAVAHDVRVELGARVLHGTPTKRHLLEMMDDTLALARMAARRARRDSLRLATGRSLAVRPPAVRPPAVRPPSAPVGTTRPESPLPSPLHTHVDPRGPARRVAAARPEPGSATPVVVRALPGGTACYVPRAPHAARPVVHVVHGPVVPEPGMLDRLGVTGWLRRLREPTPSVVTRHAKEEPEATVITTTTTTTTTTIVAGHGKTVHTTTSPASGSALPACPSPPATTP